MTEAFISEVQRVADAVGSPALTQLGDRLRRPVRYGVAGRAGVGRGCVEAALRGRGVAVAPIGEPDWFDVCVLVVAETVKAEDLAVAQRTGRPVVVVVTKADLAGAGPGGPIAVARRRALAIHRQTGAPAVPMVGLLAALADTGRLDDDLVAALRRFVTEPPNLGSVDAFVADPHPVDREVRARLLARLDRFGIAHAILALADGCEPDALPPHLSRMGNLDEVTVALDAVAAPVLYRRLRRAITELRSLAMTLGDEVSDLLADDVTVLATMTLAVDVLETAGLTVDRGDSAAAHLERAVRWSRYGRGPVNALHRHCSADVVRGSLRLLAATRSP